MPTSRHNDVAPRPQLLTYPDSLGGDLKTLRILLDGLLAGLFRGVHILPPFPSSGDRGFAPLTYQDIDPRFGTWEDVRRIAERHDVMLDLMINHLSRQSLEFQDFERHGRRSPAADLFITLDKIWPSGDPPPAEIARIFLRKPGAPFSTVTIRDTGEQERVWTSFGTADWSEQVDLDVTSEATRRLIIEWLEIFARHQVRIVRLDAVGYVIKKRDTSSFMVEPEVYDFLGWVAAQAESLGLIALPEVHDTWATHERLVAHGMWTYDFVLPGLVLHALHTGQAARLVTHLSKSPDRIFTTLDSHDGIPVRPDLDGVLGPGEMRAIAGQIEQRGGNVNRILSRTDGADVDVHQLNCTYYAALECDDDRYVAARAIQVFARGVPQIYYVGLLAGENDHAGVADSGDGRAINRHNYSTADIDLALDRPVVQRVLDLVRLRNADPAFAGKLVVSSPTETSVLMTWTAGEDRCALEADLASGRSLITTRHDGVELQFAP